MSVPMNTIKANLSKSLIRAEKQDGRDYLVAPVILLTEGVHNNVLYTAEEMAKYPHAWNGRPLPLGHPKVNGKFVSANNPALIEKYSVGQVFNVNFEAKTSTNQARLTGEVWIDTGKLKALVEKKNAKAIALANALEKDEVIEISTGLFTDDKIQPGKFNGAAYGATAMNHRPDHLALLPGGKGACSAEDGCGIRANEDGGDDSLVDKIVARVTGVFQSMAPKLTANELTASDRRNTLDRALRQKLALMPGQWFHIVDHANTYVVYEWHDDRERHQNGDGQRIRQLIRRSYQVSANDEITILDDPAQVARRTEYIPQSQQKPPVITTNADKSKGTEAMTKEEKVQAIITDGGNSFAEGDSQTLLKLNEQSLDGMLPAEPKANETDCKCKQTAPKTNAQPASPVTQDDVSKIVVNVLKETVPTLIANAVKEATAKTEAAPILQRLKANDACKLGDEILDQMTPEALSQLEQSISPGNYDGQGGIRTNTGASAPGEGAYDAGPMPALFEEQKAAE